MTKPRYKLSPQLSLRVFEDRALLIDHADGTILEVNASAGRVLNAIDRGDRLSDDEDIEFAELLVEENLASRGEQDDRARPQKSAPA